MLPPCLRSYPSPNVRVSHNVCQSMVSSGGWGGAGGVYIELSGVLVTRFVVVTVPSVTQPQWIVTRLVKWLVVSRYASGHNITTLDVLCITQAEATSKLSGFGLLHLFLFE